MFTAELLQADENSEREVEPSQEFDNMLQEEVVTDDGREFLDFLNLLSPLDTNGFYRAELESIVDDTMSTRDKTLIKKRIPLYIDKAFPIKIRRNKKRTHAPRRNRALSKRAAGKIEYAATQRLWRKNTTRSVEEILNPVGDGQALPAQEMIPYWENLMVRECHLAPELGAPDTTLVAL